MTLNEKLLSATPRYRPFGRRARITRMYPDRRHWRDNSSRVHLLEEALTHEVIGGFFETYNELGFGFREGIYMRGLEITLRRRGLVVEREFPVEVFFQGLQIGFHRVDMLVEGRVIVEAKATQRKLIVTRSDPENSGNPGSPANG